MRACWCVGAHVLACTDTQATPSTSQVSGTTLDHEAAVGGTKADYVQRMSGQFKVFQEVWDSIDPQLRITTHYEDTSEVAWGHARDLHWGQAIQMVEDADS